MLESDLRIARYFATLANIESAETLSESERRSIAGCLLKIQTVQIAVRKIAGQHRTDTEVALGCVDSVHRTVRDILNRLLNGEAVTVPSPMRAVPPDAEWRVVDGVLRYERSPVEHALICLGDLCRQRRFPFARCPVCQAVFARVKSQRFCSEACREAGATREQVNRRREYMKSYMANRRKKERTRKGGKDVKATRTRTR